MTKEEAEDYLYFSNMFRGLMVSQMSVLEKAIEEYIYTYLSKDKTKQIEILELLLDRMTFDGKRTTLEAILKKNNTTTEYKKHYKNLIEEIRKLIVKRNQFAHYVFNVEEAESQNKHLSIGLMEYRNSLNTIWYTKDEILKFVDRSYGIMQKGSVK